MSAFQPCIVFVDNTIHRIFKTVDSLKHGFQNIRLFKTEDEFWEFNESEIPDVVLLNLDLVPNDAVAILKEIKSKYREFAPSVIIYSEKQDDFVVELAFNSGADGFISFHNKASVLELFLKNLLRRKTKQLAKSERAVIIDNDKYLIFKNGIAIQLPRKEFKLFELLYHQHEKFFTKKEIAKLIWQDETVAAKRTIDVHVYNIRQFFGKRIIQSQKGKGYRMNKKVIS